MSNIELKPVCDLLEDRQGNRIRFWIPSYQRGYRWSANQVSQLLDDIWDFKQSRQEGFYCLQPLVVKKTKNDGEFEVVDGQQRLTTIHIILTSLKKQLDALEKTPYEVRYETRGEANDSFLDNIDDSRAEENPDYFYICQALETINNWFDQIDSKQKLPFLQLLLNDDDEPNVRVIWFELAISENPVNAFTRLNVGKIPLTNDELIRASFLKRSELNLMVTEHDQTNIALEWDKIENELQDDTFWYFFNNDFYSSDNRICLLFELIVGDEHSGVHDRDPYSLFYAYDLLLHRENSSVLDEWRRVRQTFSTLHEWYTDRRLYHMIGFLIHHGTPIKEILSWSSDCRKSEFDRKLVGVIFANVFGKSLSQLEENYLRVELEEQISDIEYGSRNRKKILSILLLFNLITLISNPESNSRFPFDIFKKEKWDIEHVRSIASQRLGRHEERVEWLKHCLAYLKAIDRESEMCNRIEEFIELPRGEESDIIFEELYSDVRTFFQEIDRSEYSDNSIGNLALLDQKTNRSYKNAVFAVKRTYILSLDEIGTFVPPCTRNVFLKYYSKNAQQVMFWSEDDESNYRQKIVETLFSFFWSLYI